MGFKAYVLDIEGTTTPIDFVTKTLFPFARRAMPGFLGSNGLNPTVLSSAAMLSEEYENDLGNGLTPPRWDSRPAPDGALDYLDWLMSQDRKSTGLKVLQGLVWEQGYKEGSIKGEIYPDVEPAVRRWRTQGSTVHIFSSGSVLAQQLLFGHLPQGDLTPLLDSYFDTTVGPKRNPSSYASISGQIGVSPESVLFLSDVIEEVSAARSAGMASAQVLRGSHVSDFPNAVATFDDVP